MRVIVFAARAGAAVAVLALLVALLSDGTGSPHAAPPAPAAKTRTATTAPARHGSSFTFSAVGDVVMGSGSDLPPNGGAGFFAGVADDLRADVSLANLEGTLSQGSASKCGSGSTNCFAFQTPPSYAAHLHEAGFTILNLANNHAYDFGPSGEEQTIRALEDAHLRHTGRPGEIALVTVNGTRVAVIGFAPYRWAQSLTDIAAAKRIVRRAAAEADVVVVTMHAGAEGVAHQHVVPGTETYLGENRGDALAFSHAVVDAGADLVVGSGPHVLRGMEWYRDRLIAYSLGNFAGYGVFVMGGALSTSAILHVTLRPDGRVARARLIPTALVGKGMPALDPSGGALRLVRTLSREDFGSAGATVSSTGTIGRA